MKYKAVVVTQRGGPEQLKIVEKERRLPSGDEALIRVLATPVCQDDVAVRVGNRPFLKRRLLRQGIRVWGLWKRLGRRLRPLPSATG